MPTPNQTGPNAAANHRQAPDHRRAVWLWLSLAATAALAGLAIYGSFLGTFRMEGTASARQFFNGPVLAAFWIALTALLIAGILFSSNTLRRGPSLAMHTGAVLVLLGSMANSQAGHRLANRLFSSQKIQSGLMQIDQGQTSNDVYDGSSPAPAARLPFALRLNTFSIEYYDNRPTAAAAVKSYTSDVDVQADGRTVAHAAIEVNRPLHYGGYHFYQCDYDHQLGRYTILAVTSDSGLRWVYAGMALACAGAFWLFWIQPAVAYFRRGGPPSQEEN
ncbi:MAG: cytochrome c biogenesis protein ResB [Phycisphaerae bacterium]|jgi:hypothetical protein